MPPTSTITRMFSETAQSNWPGETTPRKENSQSGTAGHRGGQTEYADLDHGGAHARRLGVGLGVADREQDRVERRVSKVPDQAVTMSMPA